MAKEYIEREPLMTKIDSFAGMFTDEGFLVDHQAVMSAIGFARAADVVEAKRGHWIYFTGINGQKQCKCSECLTSYGNMDTPYCPNCGAKMNETETETQDTNVTKFEQIKAMSVDEMVDFLIDNCDGCQTCSRKHYDSCRDIDGGCPRYIKEWLESEGDIYGVL